MLQRSAMIHHKAGPGLPESLHELALFREVWIRQVMEGQVPLPVRDKGADLDSDIRIDLLVESAVMVEVKVVERFAPIPRAQLLTYLKLTGHTVGLLLNG